MVIVNFEIGNKEFEVRSIRESGYPPTNNERGSMLVEYDVTTYCPFNIKVFSKIMSFLEKNKNGEFWFNIDKK